MSGEEERDKILSNLRNLKDITNCKTVSVTKHFTITEKHVIKDWSDKAKERNKKKLPDYKFV